MATAVAEFLDDDLNAADQAEMTVVVNGKPTSWSWFFAGPGHPKTIAQTNQLVREKLHTDREQEQTRVNGKKWKAAERSPDEIRRENIDYVMGRLLGWSPVRINGADVPFTDDNARNLLADHRKDFLKQALDFLNDDKAFTKRSATSSESTQSGTSS